MPVIKKVVDGGYLSWLYGASPWGMRQWSNGSWRKYRKSEGIMILMDHPINFRKAFYPEYKAHRAERYEENDERAEAKERVDTLRNDIILEDPRLWTIAIEGLEADDLIACMVYLRTISRDVPVVGVDKDLLQLPSMLISFEDHHGKPSTLSHFASRMPNAIRPFITKTEHIPLILALYGDKSDNVPKLVKNVREIVPILKSETPYMKAKSLYGRAFCRNLWLVILPYPELVYPIPESSDLPLILDQHGSYWVGKEFKIEKEIANIIDEVILTGVQS